MTEQNQPKTCYLKTFSNEIYSLNDLYGQEPNSFMILPIPIMLIQHSVNYRNSLNYHNSLNNPKQSRLPKQPRKNELAPRIADPQNFRIK